MNDVTPSRFEQITGRGPYSKPEPRGTSVPTVRQVLQTPWEAFISVLPGEQTLPVGGADNGPVSQLLHSCRNLPLMWSNQHMSLEVARRLMKPDSYRQRSIKLAGPFSLSSAYEDGSRERPRPFGSFNCVVFGRV